VLRFRLRTLFIVLAVAGVIAAIAGYQIRARNPYRDFLTGFNYNFGPHVTDPSEIARRLREEATHFPRHKPTDDEILERFHFRCGGSRSAGNNFGTRVP
jgi:hypothetical protein